MIGVRFLPHFKKNPYQAELAEALIHEDMVVHFASETTISYRIDTNAPLPDILHLHWVSPLILGTGNDSSMKTLSNSLMFLRSVSHLKWCSVPVVWTVHNILSHERFHHRIELFSRRFLAQLCDALIVHCHQAEKEVKKMYWVSGSKIRIIPHGSYDKSYPNKVSRTKARKILGLSSELMYLIFGQIRRYKGLSKAIDAYLSLKLRQPSALFIVGSPTDKQYLHELRSICDGLPNIRLIPRYVPDHEVQIFMNAADIIVCPYEDILTSGMVILAMSFGKITVAPAIGCIPETTKKYRAVLYNPTERCGLFNAMKKARMLSAQEASTFDTHLRTHVHCPPWTEVAKETRMVYLECLKKIKGS